MATTTEPPASPARRLLLRAAAAGAAVLALSAHSPYAQWQAYRRQRLIVAVDGADDGAVALGGAVAAALARDVPESRAMLARARDLNDLVRLLQSAQLDAALMRAVDARAALDGSGPAADGGSVALRALARFGPYLFVSRAELPDGIAHELAEALNAQRDPIAAVAAVAATESAAEPVAIVAVPPHRGAFPHYRGD